MIRGKIRDAGARVASGELGSVEEEYAELPGAAGIGLNLDPEKLKKKSLEEFVAETAQDWFTAVMGFKDLTAQAELKGIWDPMLNPLITATKEQKALSLHSSVFKDLYGVTTQGAFESSDRFAASVRDFVVFGNSADKRGVKFNVVQTRFALALKRQLDETYDPRTASPEVTALKRDLDRVFSTGAYKSVDGEKIFVKDTDADGNKLSAGEMEKVRSSIESRGNEDIDSIWKRAMGSKDLGDTLGDNRLVAFAQMLDYRKKVFEYNELLDAVAEGKFFQLYMWSKIKTKIKFLTPAFKFASFVQDPVRGGLRILIGNKNSPINKMLQTLMDKVAKGLDGTLGALAQVLSGKASGLINLVSGGAIKIAIRSLVSSALTAAGASGVGTLPAAITAALIYVGEKAWNIIWHTMKLDLGKALDELGKEMANIFKFVAGITGFTVVVLILALYFIVNTVLAPLGGTQPYGETAGGVGGGTELPTPSCNDFNCFGSGVTDFESSLNCAAATLSSDTSGPLWRLVDEYGPYCDNETRNLPFAYNLFVKFYDKYVAIGTPAGRSCATPPPETARPLDAGYRCTGTSPRCFNGGTCAVPDPAVNGIFAYYREALRDCEVPNAQLKWTTDNSFGKTPEELADYMTNILNVSYSGFSPPPGKLLQVLQVAKAKNVNPWLLVGIWGTESWFSQTPQCLGGTSTPVLGPGTAPGGEAIACSATTSGTNQPVPFSKTNGTVFPGGSGQTWSCFGEDRTVGGVCVKHGGIDLAAPTGAFVLSPYDGDAKVVFASSAGNFGQLIVIQAQSGGTALPYYMYFAHLKSFSVPVGSVVTKGTTLGQVDSTGYSSGPHLHFEIRSGSNDRTKQVNPCATSFACPAINTGGSCPTTLNL